MAAKAKTETKKKIIILGQKWQVLTVEEIPNGLSGECLSDKTTILLSSKYSEESRKEILMHEMLHAICSISGISVEFEDMPGCIDLEEYIVSRLSPLLYTVLKENKMDFSKE